jgi:predicted nucleic acid-binding protein
MKFIVDANIAIKWLMPEPDSAVAIDLLDHTLLAPELLLPECLNVLWHKRVKQELTAEEAVVALTALAAAQIEWLPVTPLMPAILDLAIRLKHPAYDCTYLAAAIHVGAPMVTADSRFVRRCRQADAKDLGPFIRLLGEPVAGAEH